MVCVYSVMLYMVAVCVLQRQHEHVTVSKDGSVSLGGGKVQLFVILWDYYDKRGQPLAGVLRFATKSVTEGIDECSPAQRSLTASRFFHGTPRS